MPEPPDSSDLERLIAEREDIERRLREHHSRSLGILFSDIVGSTEIFERQGDIAGLALVRRHNAILFPVVEAKGGRVVKTIGDAIMAVFDAPADGVECAVAMQRALAVARATDAAAAPIHIRVGVHAGEAMLDGGDVFGDTVNTAARVVGQAAGDEILVSAALFDAVPAGAGLEGRPKGEVALKGKRDPVPLVSVVWGPAAADAAAAGLGDVRLADPDPGPAADPEVFVLDLGLGPRGLKVAVVDGPKDKGPVRAYAEPGLDLDALDALAGRFAAFLDGDADGAAYVSGLEAAGRALFDTALSDRARRHLRKTGCTYLRLHVDDALAHLPWELAHDGERFLGRRFAAGRVVATRNDDEHTGAGRVPGTGHALVVSDPTGDLEAARREGEAVAALMTEGYGGEVRHLAGPVTRDALLEALPGCRILHFAGHVMEGAGDADGGFTLADGLLPASAVAAAVAMAPPELVVANGCHGGGDRAFTDGARRAGSVAASLLLGGVRHFLGPVGLVPDADALTFALRFHEAVLAGRPYGEAARLGRSALQDAGRLAFARYLFYGEPRSALDPALARRQVEITRSFPPREIPEPVAEAAPAAAATPAPAAAAAPAPGPAAGRRPGRLVAAGVGIVVLAAAGGWLATRPPHRTAPRAKPAPVAVAPHRAKPAPPRTGPVAIAVLPFKNLTGAKSLAPLSEGLTESVITGFAGAKGIHLVEHVQIGADIHYEEWTHSKFVDPKTRARIGKIVGCEVVVLGGYQRAGRVIRATARLVRVDTGEILAAVAVERDQSKVFALQDAVARALRADLPSVEKDLRP